MNIYTLEGDGDGVLTSGVARVLVEVQRAVTRHFQRTYDCTIRKVSQGWYEFSCTVHLIIAHSFAFSVMLVLSPLTSIACQYSPFFYLLQHLTATASPVSSH